MRKFLILLMCIMLTQPFIISAAGNPMQKNEIDLPILMYHNLLGNKGSFSVSPEEFEKDLAYLSANGYTAIGVNDLIDYAAGAGTLPDKPVMLTFDDGYYNNYLYGFPLLKKYNTKIVLSVIGKHSEIWSENYYEDEADGHATWAQIKEMVDSGLVEIANHTYDLHDNNNIRKGCGRAYGEDLFGYMTLLGRDLEKTQLLLKENCGITPVCFTYPYHEVCPDSFAVLRAVGINAAFTKSGRHNKIVKGDPDCLYDLKRVNRTRFTSAEKILSQD